MAIFWVDPHIGAAVQANGTTSTTIRDGSYASPWSIQDISSTSQTTLPTKMTPLVSGDEIRFKGLPINTYTFELPNTTFRIASSAGGSSTDLTSFRTNGVADSALITTDYVGTGAGIWPRMLYVSAIPALNNTPGFIPVQSISNSGGYFTFSGSSTWSPGYGYTAMGTAAFTARMVKYKEYGIDINTLVGSTSWILPRVANGVTVTAGWTSDTVRDGVTLLLLWSSATSAINWFRNTSTFSNAVGRFDCPELFLLHGSKGSNQNNGTFTVGAGGSGTTSVLGGVANSYSSSQHTLYTTAGATLEVRYSYHTAYGWSATTTTVNSADPSSNVLQFTNTIGGYSNGYSSISSTNVTFRIGNYHGGSNSSTTQMFQVSTSTATTAARYVFLDNSIITGYGASNKAACQTVPRYVTMGTGVTNTFSGRITEFGTYPGTADRPIAVYSLSSGIGLASQNFEMIFSASTLLVTSISNMNEGAVYVGELDMAGQDYKTRTSCLIQDSFTNVIASGLSRSYVYQSNSYDGRPLMLMISGDHFPCFLYNDSTKDEALTWHQFTESATKFFQKDIPVAIPAYTTEQVDFQAVYSTSAAYNGSMVMELWTVNSQTGVPTLQGTVTVNGANLADSQMNVTLTNSNLTTNNIKTAYLRMKFTGGATGGEKFWLQSVTATLPTP